MDPVSDVFLKTFELLAQRARTHAHDGAVETGILFCHFRRGEYPPQKLSIERRPFAVIVTERLVLLGGTNGSLQHLATEFDSLTDAGGRLLARNEQGDGLGRRFGCALFRHVRRMPGGHHRAREGSRVFGSPRTWVAPEDNGTKATRGKRDRARPTPVRLWFVDGRIGLPVPYVRSLVLVDPFAAAAALTLDPLELSKPIHDVQGRRQELVKQEFTSWFLVGRKPLDG